MRKASIEEYSLISDADRNAELEVLVKSLKGLLTISRNREKRLVAALEKIGGEISFDIESGVEGMDLTELTDAKDESNISFFSSLQDRGGWLVGLLIFQSCSSFILSANNSLLTTHPSVVFFLTMLVGTGGNAGNQSSVRVIRGLALGTINSTNIKAFLLKELFMAFAISSLLGTVGLLRTLSSSETTFSEGIAITLALITIAFSSIIIGALLPFGLQYLRIDPGNI